MCYEQAHAAYPPDTTRPETRAPARLITPTAAVDAFDAIQNLRRVNSDTHHNERVILERLPGPHLTRCPHNHAFPLNAHHDGLQPTQHREV
jgi:hypothetical protein